MSERSWSIDAVKINGTELQGVFGDQITEATLMLSRSAEPTLSLTILDRPDLGLTAQAARVFHNGSVFTWGEWSFGLNSFTTGGGSEAPTIQVEAISDVVRVLKDEKGGQSWGSQQVSAWVKEQAERLGTVALTQYDLGERRIQRQENQDDPEDGESTWDVMAELAKQVGAWLFDDGERLVMARPAWLASRVTGVDVYRISWNSWTDHTDGLVAAPEYTWDKDKKLYDGRETLTVQAVDPGPGQENPLATARPGRMLHFTGNAAVSSDPVWIITGVEHHLTAGHPVVITAQRPIDPPQKKEAGAEGSGESQAGVPDGPIGAAGWNGEQLRNAAEIVKEGQRRKVQKIGIVIAVMAAMQESSLRNLDHGDEAQGVTNPDGTPTTSKGLFQQQDSWGPLSVRMNPAKSAGLFYDRLVTLDYKSAASSAERAGQMAQTVQGSAHPHLYAQHWGDANKVVSACIEAGKAAAEYGTKAPGELGRTIDRLMASYEGKNIDVDGYPVWNRYQCYDLAQRYLTDLTGIGTIRGDGWMWWRHEALMGKFTPIAANKTPRKGDIASWRQGALYSAVGHVAIFSHIKNGHYYFQSQNPGRTKTQPLPTEGLSGFMRPRSTED